MYIQDVLALVLLLCLIVVPHITDAVQEWVMNQAKVPVDDDRKEPQICVIEASIEYFRIYIHSEHKELAYFVFYIYCKKKKKIRQVLWQAIIQNMFCILYNLFC